MGKGKSDSNRESPPRQTQERPSPDSDGKKGYVPPPPPPKQKPEILVSKREPAKPKED